MKALLLSFSILAIALCGVSISCSIQETAQFRQNQERLADTLKVEARLLAEHRDQASICEVVRSYLIFRTEPNLASPARDALIDAKAKYPALFDQVFSSLSSHDQAVISAS